MITKAISASAVQRGTTPRIRAMGPSTSIATAAMAHASAYGKPFAARDAENATNPMALLIPDGRKRVARRRRPTNRTASLTRFMRASHRLASLVPWKRADDTQPAETPYHNCVLSGWAPSGQRKRRHPIRIGLLAIAQ